MRGPDADHVCGALLGRQNPVVSLRRKLHYLSPSTTKGLLNSLHAPRQDLLEGGNRHRGQYELRRLPISKRRAPGRYASVWSTSREKSSLPRARSTTAPAARLTPAILERHRDSPVRTGRAATCIPRPSGSLAVCARDLSGLAPSDWLASITRPAPTARARSPTRSRSTLLPSVQ